MSKESAAATNYQGAYNHGYLQGLVEGRARERARLREAVRELGSAEVATAEQMPTYRYLVERANVLVLLDDEA